MKTTYALHQVCIEFNIASRLGFIMNLQPMGCPDNIKYSHYWRTARLCWAFSHYSSLKV